MNFFTGTAPKAKLLGVFCVIDNVRAPACTWRCREWRRAPQ